jgi:hypothetical protein
MHNLQKLIQEILTEKKQKRDRCLRIADRKFDKPSAYKSGAVVRCRKGNIWKGLKEDSNNNQKHIIYPNFQGVDAAENPTGIEKEINVKDAIGNEPNKDFNYFQTEKKQYIKNMIKNAKGDGWKSFDPIIAINHPLLPGKFLVIDGNHRLGAFKIGDIPKIKTIIVNEDDILLAIPGTEWQEGKTPKTINLKDAKGKVNFKEYFATKDLKIPTNLKELISKIVTEDESLHKWFKRSGTPGKEGGWVDCNAPTRKDGKITGYKPCGRKEGEKRAKYPSCRPTAAKCKDKGKGKTWGKTK